MILGQVRSTGGDTSKGLGRLFYVIEVGNVDMDKVPYVT